MARFLLSVVFATVLALFVAATSAVDVVVGTADNFESLVSKDELVLVKFFAPWCGHCKKMAKDFEQAATELKGKATLVDLDVTVEKDIAEKYGIKGFPTLKLFSKGEIVSDYKGGRTKDALVSYIERALLPSVTECNDADAIATFTKDNAPRSLFFGAKLEKLTGEYNKVAMALRDVMPDSVAFASVDDPALLKSLAGKDVQPDTILLLHTDKTSEIFSGEPDAFEKWAKIASLPLYDELNRDNASVYTELDAPIVLLFQDPAKKDKDVNDVITEVAKEFRSNAIAFTWINIVELKSFAEHVGVAEKTPALGIYNFKSDQKYVFPDEFSKDTLIAWVNKFLDGKVIPSTKSAPIPETNDELVKIVVGDSWIDIVQDESKDVLIEQYAPWCGHCKRLAPILDSLAKDLKDVKTLVIAKMDSTMNDPPTAYKAQGYPTIHFFPAGSKEGTVYSGGRKKEDFVKFLKENATHKEGMDVEISEETKVEDEKKEEL